MIQYALNQKVKTSRIKVQNWYTQYIERTERLTQEQKLNYLYKYYFK